NAPGRGPPVISGVLTPPCWRVTPVAGMLDLMSDVTRILSAIEQGDPHAPEQLLPLVYDELRKLPAPKLAQAKPGQTPQAAGPVPRRVPAAGGRRAAATRKRQGPLLPRRRRGHAQNPRGSGPPQANREARR